jgi:hypothetical protein
LEAGAAVSSHWVDLDKQYRTSQSMRMGGVQMRLKSPALSWKKYSQRTSQPKLT